MSRIISSLLWPSISATSKMNGRGAVVLSSVAVMVHPQASALGSDCTRAPSGSPAGGATLREMRIQQRTDRGFDVFAVDHSGHVRTLPPARTTVVAHGKPLRRLPTRRPRGGRHRRLQR